MTECLVERYAGHLTPPDKSGAPGSLSYFCDASDSVWPLV